MDFYNREREIAVLDRALARSRPQFIVVYGRRRCGKSTLLRKVLKPGDCYFLATLGDAAQQRRLFAQQLAQKHPGFDFGDYQNWYSLFAALAARGGARYRLVIDELPYLPQADISVASVLQSLLEDRSVLPFDIIVCGSSQQMMERAVLSASAPLYGRADEIIHLRPLEAGYLRDALPNQPANDLIAEYAVWGGVPRYWELRKQFGTLHEAITELLFEPSGLLIDEPRRLLLDDISELATPLSILTQIAAGAHRLSEIGARLQKSSADLLRPLARLTALGYVNKEVPFGESYRSTKRTYYEVADPFMRFYHRFVVPNMSDIQIGRGDLGITTFQQQYDQHVGFAWEHLCRRVITKGTLGFEYGSCARWWGKMSTGQELELDGVARSVDGKQLLLLEAKWSSNVDISREASRLRSRAFALPFYQGEEIVPVIACREEVQAPEGVRVLTPQQVIQALR